MYSQGLPDPQDSALANRRLHTTTLIQLIIYWLHAGSRYRLDVTLLSLFHADTLHPVPPAHDYRWMMKGIVKGNTHHPPIVQHSSSSVDRLYPLGPVHRWVQRFDQEIAWGLSPQLTRESVWAECYVLYSWVLAVSLEKGILGPAHSSLLWIHPRLLAQEQIYPRFTGPPTIVPPQK